MSKIRVLLGWKPTEVELETAKRSFPSDCEILIPQDGSEEGLVKLSEDVDVFIGQITAATLKAAKKLKLVHITGHGVDFILKDHLREMLIERKIPLAKSNSSAIPIAEFVIMSMVALSRRAFKLHEALAYRGSWSEEIKKDRMRGSLGGELYGRTLGIISLGEIGIEVARRGKAFGMEVMAIQKKPKPQLARDLGIDFLGGLDNFEKVLRASDYIVLSLPLIGETRGLVGQKEFDMMKDGTYLVNISRGPIVESEALYEALKRGKLAGAAIDVWEPGREKARPSPYPMDRPIHQFNVVMTPHYSGLTKESRLRAITMAGENMKRLINGEPLKNLVDFSKGY